MVPRFISSDPLAMHAKWLALMCVCCTISLYLLYAPTTSSMAKVNSVQNSAPPAKRYLTSCLCATKNGNGFANVLFEYFALLGIAHELKRTPFLPVPYGRLQRSVDQIAPTFPGLLDLFELVREQNFTKVQVHTKGCCVFDPYPHLFGRNETFLQTQGALMQSYKYFWSIRPTLLRAMKPAEPQTWPLPAERRAEKTLCIQARRGNFVSSGPGLPANAEFTVAATAYLLRKDRSLRNVLLFSNDNNWLRATFRDVFVNKSNTAVHDSREYFIFPKLSNTGTLALAYHHCHTVLITASVSTFGWMIGFLGDEGRANVFYAEKAVHSGSSFKTKFRPFDFFPTEWTPLRLHPNGVIEETALRELTWERISANKYSQPAGVITNKSQLRIK